LTGSDHTEIAFFVFGDAFIGNSVSHAVKFTDEEMKTADNIMSYFANFAKTGYEHHLLSDINLHLLGTTLWFQSRTCLAF